MIRLVLSRLLAACAAVATRPLRAVLLLALAAAGAAARAENVYIMDLTQQGIYTVDIVSGGPATQLVPINAPAGTEGYTLAVRPSDGMLFYLDSSVANPNLWRWNPETPTLPPVLVGTPGATTTDVVRLGFDSANNLLAMNTTNSMWTLDQNTGGIVTTTPLSGSLPTASGDLCLNHSTGVLYMVADQQLYTVTNAGVSTLLGTITGLPAAAYPNNLVTGCAFTRNGTLLVSRYNGGPLYRVNLASLVGTALPTLTGIAQIGDLATAPSRTSDLRIAKTANTSTPGSTVSFTITVTNDGPHRAADVRVLDVLPAGLTLTSTTPSQGIYYAAAPGAGVPAGTWRAGALPPGQSATLTMNATVTGAALITNTAQISYSDEYDPDSTPNNNVAGEDDQASVTITPSPDLRVAKTALGSFTVGLNGQYTIQVSNAGPAASSGVYTVTDVLPAGLAFVSATGTGWTCGAAAGTVTCTSSTVIAANNANPNLITLTVLPSAPAAPQVSNTATVAGGGEPANNNGDNASTATTAVCNSNCPDLRVNKTLSTANLDVGVATSVYTLSVTNIGGLTTGVNPYTITDTLPAGLTLAAAPTPGAGWTCTAAGPTTNVAGGTIVSCTRAAALAPTVASTNITFPVNVLNAAAPQVTNTASVSGGGEPPATQGNNSTSLTTPVRAFDLTVTKAKNAAPANFAVGAATGSYTFTVNNIGALPTNGSYSFTDTLPAGLTLRTASGGAGWTINAGWACAPAGSTNTLGGNIVSCTRNTVIAAAGTSTTVVVPINVAGAAAPSVTNTVTVSGVNESPNLTGNNSFTLVTPVDAPDLVVTKSHNGTLAVGVTETYTVTVTNVGDVATSAAITVTDTLPAGLTYVSTAGTGAGWACGFAAGTVTCTHAANLAANSSAPPVVINVRPTATGTVINTASVSGGNEPPSLNGNNSANDTTVVGTPPVIAKSFSPATISVGGSSTLTLTITNPAGSGMASMSGLSFADPFPAGLSVANPPNLVNTCGGTITGGSQGDTTLSLANGSLGGPGTNCQVMISVTATTAGAKVNTTGEIRSTNGGIGNTASATLTVNAPGTPILTKVSAPGVVGVGEIANMTFTITNSAAVSNNIAFRDTFNANVLVAGAFTPTNCARNNLGGAAVITATVGTSVVNVTGLDLNANEVCTIVVPIRSNVAGSYSNTSANINNVAGGLNVATASDVLEVQAVTLSKDFAPSTIFTGNTATMTLTLANGAGLPEQNGIAFTETLPANVTLSVAPSASQCGGTVTGAAGGNTVAVSGATLAAGQAGCTVTAVITSNVAGTYNNVAGNISAASVNVVNNVNATLTVTVPLPTLVKTNGQSSISPGDTTTYVITVGNTTSFTFTAGSAVVLRDPAVANLTVNSAACAAQGGAACPALASGPMITALQTAAPGGLTVPSLPPGGTVTFTLQAQLTGNPTGTVTNTITATSNGASVGASDTDSIVYPALLNTKTATVLNDPVNGTSNPKNIPGAEVLYTVTIANTASGRVDSDTLQIADSVPARTVLFVGNLGGSPPGPVSFSDAAAGLAFTFTALGAVGDDVEFSNNNGGSWGYTPTPDGNGYDAAVTNIRLRPKGRMAGWSGAGPFPSFTFTFKVKVN